MESLVLTHSVSISGVISSQGSTFKNILYTQDFKIEILIQTASFKPELCFTVTPHTDCSPLVCFCVALSTFFSSRTTKFSSFKS